MKIQIKDDIESWTEDAVADAIARLPEWRREQALKFKFLQGKAECALSYHLLCEMLGGINPQPSTINPRPHFVIGEHGKPVLLEYPDIHFNISHCKRGIACIVSEEGPVGIDIECTGRYDQSLARYVLSDEELRGLGTWSQAHGVQGDEAIDIDFTRLWTQKEALVKLTGRGIEDDLKTILQAHPEVEIHTELCTAKGYVYSWAVYK